VIGVHFHRRSRDSKGDRPRRDVWYRSQEIVICPFRRPILSISSAVFVVPSGRTGLKPCTWRTPLERVTAVAHRFAGTRSSLAEMLGLCRTHPST
jgi:hypothetical protein